MAKTIGDYFLRGLEQGQERGSKAAQSARDQQQKADLENYLMGQKIKAVEDLRQRYPEQDVGAEGVYIRERDQLSNYLRGQQIDALQEERDRKRVQDVADRVEKTGLAKIAAPLQQAEKSFKGKSVGPFLNILPVGIQAGVTNIMSRIGESRYGPESWKGAGEEFQDLQKLMNIDTREFTGASATRFEQARKEVEQGLRMGGSAEQVARGIQSMREIYEQEAKNIQAGAHPAAVAEYSKRMGIGSIPDILGKPPGQAPMQQSSPEDAEKKRYEELKAKARGQ